MNSRIKKLIEIINNKCYNDYWLIRLEIINYLKKQYKDDFQKMLKLNPDLIEDIIDIASTAISEK